MIVLSLCVCVCERERERIETNINKCCIITMLITETLLKVLLKFYILLCFDGSD